MRLGGPVFYEGEDPEEFVRIHTLKGYRAALCPQNLKAGQTQKIQAYRAAAARKDLIYAEVGAWCNPLSEDPKEAGQARERIIERLSLAEELGARACVNVIGTRCPGNWYGPDEKNYSEDFFAEAVSVYRSVIDAVRPKRTRMTFEMMPYSFLDCAQEYLRFLKAAGPAGSRRSPGPGQLYQQSPTLLCEPGVDYRNLSYLCGSPDLFRAFEGHPAGMPAGQYGFYGSSDWRGRSSFSNAAERAGKASGGYAGSTGASEGRTGV